MADGRMLKNKISRDVTVADLPTDTDRVLFTWAISHLDIEGRISGDPREFKASVVPLLDHITPLLITEFFEVAESLGLIHRYQANGRWVIEFPGFIKNQSLRRDKEKESEFPPPTPGSLPDHSRTTPAEDKIKEVIRREEKLKEGKERECEGKPKEPDSETQEQKERFRKSFQVKCNRLRPKYPRFNPELFFQNNLNGNRDAILLCLDRLLEAETPISNPEAYCEKIISIESGNFNEREAIKIHEEIKKNSPSSLGDCLKKAMK